MLSIKNLHANVGDKPILKGINLEIKPGEVHAIMGPNGSGKSTLGNVLSGRPGYDVTKGEVLFEGKDLFELEPYERANAGLFLAMQYPVEVPGVNNAYFLRAALNAKLKAQGKGPIEAFDFMQLAKTKMALMEMDQKFLKRGLNEGFSGGEKKKNEILQMLLLEPKLGILDETDSGLDIDALQLVAKGVNHMRDKNRSFIVVTHYQRLLDYIEPDYVHILAHGKIVKSGDKHLALELEKQGYADYVGQGEGA